MSCATSRRSSRVSSGLLSLFSLPLPPAELFLLLLGSKFCAKECCTPSCSATQSAAWRVLADGGLSDQDEVPTAWVPGNGDGLVCAPQHSHEGESLLSRTFCKNG
jgi:hypothetical protein